MRLHAVAEDAPSQTGTRNSVLSSHVRHGLGHRHPNPAIKIKLWRAGIERVLGPLTLSPLSDEDPHDSGPEESQGH